MKLPCEMVRDLLPLYHDGVCSQVTGTLLEEHLKGCGDCSRVLMDMKEELNMPKLEKDEAKPLRSIRKKWKKRTWLKGSFIGLTVFLAALIAWFQLTQTCSVAMTAEEYQVTQVCRFANGMYYLEYKLPFESLSYSADIHRTAEGEIHVRHYRPRLIRKDEEKGTIRDFLIDPEHNLLHADTGEIVPLTAFYLGCPDQEEAVLVWSADMEVPAATPEQEEMYLYNSIFG